jgi:hypothetical protein
MVCYLPVIGVGILSMVLSDPGSLNSKYQLYEVYLAILFLYFILLFVVWSVYLYWNRELDIYYSKYWTNRFARIFSTVFYVTKLLISLIYYQSGNGSLTYFAGAQLCDAFFEVLVVSGIFLFSTATPTYAILIGCDDWIEWHERHSLVMRPDVFLPIPVPGTTSAENRVRPSSDSYSESSLTEDRQISAGEIPLQILPTIVE